MEHHEASNEEATKSSGDSLSTSKEKVSQTLNSPEIVVSSPQKDAIPVTDSVPPTNHDITCVEASSLQETYDNASGRLETNQRTKEKFNCDYCEFESTEQRDVFAHVLSDHEIERCPEHNCAVCEKVFVEVSQLQDHIKSAHQVVQYLCDKCDYKTTDQELLNTHVNFSHDEPIPEKFTCEECKDEFNEKTKLEEHQETHKKQISYLCDLCAQETNSDEDLIQHKLSNHQEEIQTIQQQSPTENIGKENPTFAENENIELKRKLRIMEESYDRLMFMFQKQQTEIKDKTLAFKIQVETATESYRVAKKENEKLKEANEIQQKLWKVFLDKFEKDEAVKKDGGADTPQTKPKDPEPREESDKNTEDDCEDIDLESSYDEWLKDTRKR